MIEINNLSFHYQKGNDILRDINTTFASGQVYGLFGLNGCGKTTLLKILASCLYPKTGTITVSNFKTTDRKQDYLADLYFVADEVDLPNWSIKEICKTYAPLYSKFDQDYFDEILTKFQVNKQARIKDLSFGQRKKVNLAFALATNVSLLLMDEPTNGLDIPAKAQFRKLIAQHLSPEKTIFISTHQTRDLQHLIDHILIIKDHKLILDASIFELSKKLLFKPGKFENALYTENNPNGSLSILLNNGEEETSFDIDFFFNALHEQPTILTHLNITNHYDHAE